MLASRSGRTLRLAVAAILAAFAAGGIALFNPRVEQWLFERGATQRTRGDNLAPLADDALRVAICGSAAPLPSAARAEACVAVFAGGKFYLVDVGPKSVENLRLWGLPLARIGAVFLTHFHSDHIGELGEVNFQTWAVGRPERLAVYGGPGVEEVVAGFNQAYRLDQTYRTRHHTERLMPPGTWPMEAHTLAMPGPETTPPSRTMVALDDGSLRVTAIEVDHAPIAPAYAYRFDYRGRSVVVTGDLKYHPPLAGAARGADIMVSEAVARPMLEALQRGAAAAGRERQATILHDIEDYHVAPEEAADVADRAGVKLLVLYHLLPSPDSFLTRRLFVSGLKEARHGRWDLADDGSLYTMPLGSDEVRIGRIPGSR